MTKNGENRTSVRYEPRRNFKGDDSLGGTDLSARLSFAKRAREVKAANETTVFKEDYPRDDKSIEDDERPNRSRVSEPSRTYRKSISDAEKSKKEIDERSGDARDTSDARTSRDADEKLRKLNENRNELVRETGCSPVNIFTSKIKRKKISRGVQCISIGCRNSAGRFLLSCFKSKSGHNLTRKAKRKKASANKFNVRPQNEVNRSPNTTTINDESHKVIKEEIKSTSDIDTKKEKFEKIGEEKIERIIYGNDKELLVQMQNIYDIEKSKDNDSKYRKVKINLLDKLRLRKALTCRNDSKAQQNGSRHESRNHKEEIVEFSFENEKTNDGRKREDNSQSTKIVDREMDSSNRRKSAIVSTDRGNVNKIKERLDLCIIELNEIIGDACAIFGNQKNAAKNNDRGC